MKELKDLTIVYAEDNEVVRESVVAFLSRRVKTIHEAGDGVEAWEKIQALHPDVVITDIEMPRMNGLELILRIRKEYPEKLVIALTAYDDDEHYSPDANVYFIKPLKLIEIINFLRKYLEDRL